MHQLFQPPVVVLALVLMPVYGAMVRVGTKLLRLASETTFRRIAYVIITGAALDSLPAFDRSSH